MGLTGGECGSSTGGAREGLFCGGLRCGSDCVATAGTGGCTGRGGGRGWDGAVEEAWGVWEIAGATAELGPACAGAPGLAVVEGGFGAPAPCDTDCVFTFNPAMTCAVGRLWMLVVKLMVSRIYTRVGAKVEMTSALKAGVPCSCRQVGLQRSCRGRGFDFTSSTNKPMHSKIEALAVFEFVLFYAA